MLIGIPGDEVINWMRIPTPHDRDHLEETCDAI
jgi:hypothetical protein